MYWELSQKDFVFQKCSLVSVSETSFKEIKQRKKEENFTVVFPYFFNLNLMAFIMSFRSEYQSINMQKSNRI